MARSTAKTMAVLSGSSNDNHTQSIRNVKDDKNYTSFVHFIAEMIEKYGLDVLNELK